MLVVPRLWLWRPTVPAPCIESDDDVDVDDVARDVYKSNRALTSTWTVCAQRCVRVAWTCRCHPSRHRARVRSDDNEHQRLFEFMGWGHSFFKTRRTLVPCSLLLRSSMIRKLFISHARQLDHLALHTPRGAPPVSHRARNASTHLCAKIHTKRGVDTRVPPELHRWRSPCARMRAP